MTKRKRFPSFFDEFFRRMRREMRRGFPTFGEEEEEEYWSPFEEMMNQFEEEVPEEFEEFVKEEKTPHGKVRRYGPFVYGFSYSKKPGEEPEIQEFGNIKPTGRGRIKPSPQGEREPLVEVVDLNGKYEVTIEMPGVEKEEIDLSATEEKLRVKTTGERKYQKSITFEEKISPETIDANFRNGILTLEIEKKKEEEEGKQIEIK